MIATSEYLGSEMHESPQIEMLLHSACCQPMSYVKPGIRFCRVSSAYKERGTFGAVIEGWCLAKSDQGYGGFVIWADVDFLLFILFLVVGLHHRSSVSLVHCTPSKEASPLTL